MAAYDDDQPWSVRRERRSRKSTLLRCSAVAAFLVIVALIPTHGAKAATFATHPGITMEAAAARLEYQELSWGSASLIVRKAQCQPGRNGWSRVGWTGGGWLGTARWSWFWCDVTLEPTGKHIHLTMETFGPSFRWWLRK